MIGATLVVVASVAAAAAAEAAAEAAEAAMKPRRLAAAIPTYLHISSIESDYTGML